MPTKCSQTPLRAEAWAAERKGDVAVGCSDGTSVVLRREGLFVYVRPALHGVWPDEAKLTAGQLRELAARMIEMAEAIDPGGLASADEAFAEVGRAAEAEECGDRPLGEKPSVQPRVSSSCSGPLLDAIEEGLVEPPAAAPTASTAEARCFVCRAKAAEAPCGKCKGAKFAGEVRVPGADGPVKVWALPDGKGWALCEDGRFGNWHVKDLPEADYRPTVDELEWAIAEQLSLNADVKDWHSDGEFHALELCRVYRVQVTSSKPPAKTPPDVSHANIDLCELHDTPAGKGPWRKVPLKGKFPPDQVRVLKDAGIETVGALADYVASGKDVAAIKGVDDGLGRLIVGCLRFHWQREVAESVDAPYPPWLEPAVFEAQVKARQGVEKPKKRKGVKR